MNRIGAPSIETAGLNDRQLLACARAVPLLAEVNPQTSAAPRALCDLGPDGVDDPTERRDDVRDLGRRRIGGTRHHDVPLLEGLAEIGGIGHDARWKIF